jgi:epoxyqueuosine reductase
METFDYQDLLRWIKTQAKELGFAELRVTDLDVSEALPYLQDWLEKGHHGDMNYMSQHAHLRADPKKILPQALRVITLRMNYLPQDRFLEGVDWRQEEWDRIHQPESAIISVYARGRDYHKVLRARLQILAKKIEERISRLNYRVAVDSVPLMEVEFAKKSGLAWRGKHTLALHREAGSMFFLGEILIGVPLPVDTSISDHCGECQACIDICPTKAITGPYKLDARRCISYLTIEHRGSIPLEMRELIGNRIYGCDDCQLICPWNKFASPSQLGDFVERNQLGKLSLLEIFSWTKVQFDQKMQGSAIYRIGYPQFMRNVAIGLGNVLRHHDTPIKTKESVRSILQSQYQQIDALVDEHIKWALGD